MDRRSFLKLLGAPTAAVAAPMALADVGPELPVPIPPVGGSARLSATEWGEAIRFDSAVVPANDWGAFFDDLIRELGDIAGRKLPKGQRFEIRAHAEDFGRTHKMAWYSNAKMQLAETWEPYQAAKGDDCYVPEGGYYLFARGVA